MARMTVAAFLDSVADDESLQEDLVALAADRGFSFTADELSDAEPGATAEPLTWKNLAGFPTLGSLPSAIDSSSEQDVIPFWKNPSILAASNIALGGTLVWLLWRNRRISNRLYWRIAI